MGSVIGSMFSGMASMGIDTAAKIAQKVLPDVLPDVLAKVLPPGVDSTIRFPGGPGSAAEVKIAFQRDNLSLESKSLAAIASMADKIAGSGDELKAIPQVPQGLWSFGSSAKAAERENRVGQLAAQVESKFTVLRGMIEGLPAESPPRRQLLGILGQSDSMAGTAAELKNLADRPVSSAERLIESRSAAAGGMSAIAKAFAQ